MIRQVLQYFKSAGIEERIPLIPAGGIDCADDIRRLQGLGAAAVQLGTAFDCLAHCGLRDGVASMGQFCIDQKLGEALGGDTRKGLFFRGAGTLPFGSEIRTVPELMQWLLGGIRPTTPVPETST